MVSKKLPASLFVGAAATGKRTLVSKLTGMPLSAIDSCGQWCIDNPYYTADTKVVIRRPDGSKFGSLTGYEAIILVFDAADKSSWEAVRAWALANADAAEATEITLAVAAKYDTASTPSSDPRDLAWHDEVQDWCFEHHFEFIRTAAGHEPTDASLASGVDDPEGVLRVRAALEAHLWPGLQRKDAAATDASTPRGPAADTPREAEGPEDSDEEEDREVAKQAAEMDALFAEVLAARESVHGLGDEARREAAARLALRLADAFGLDDEGGSDEE